MDDLGEYPFSDLLRQFRAGARLSQQKLSKKLRVHRNTVVAWERGDYLPKTPSRIKELADALRLGKEDTERLSRAAFRGPSPKHQEESEPRVETISVSLASSLFWNVPYRRNPFFTGREIVLKRLHDMLTSEKAAALTQAISGLGGVGKTQTAVEYAYRYTGDYKTILWARADSRETLVSDFLSIANLLKLPEKDEQDHSRVVNACKRWLNEHADWLLILDNAEDLALASDFIPAGSKGHTLLTTREQVTGAMAQRIELATMNPEEGALFLLRRAKMLATDAPLDNISLADRTRAREISQSMGGLPLALDQAGAYIEATECGLAGYLERYKQQRAKLLELRGEADAYGHPKPVATTWSLSFDRVQEANSAAADLLRLCAFLHPDAIPEEIITAGAPDLGSRLRPFATDLIKLDTVISELRKYSLLSRNPDTQSLTIHRLVQAVLKDAMGKVAQRKWAERAVRAVNRAFPDPEFAVWDRCQRCLPHVQACAALIKQWNIAFPEAARLLHETGCYLTERGRYREAKPLLRKALGIRELCLGAGHADVAESLNELAILYNKQGKHAQAEKLYQRVLVILEQALGPGHPHVGKTLNNLALLYHEQGKYTQAEPLYQQALALYEQTFGPEHLEVAVSLNNLGLLYEKQGRYAQAASLHQRSLAIRRQVLGPEHPKVGNSLNNLAIVYRAQCDYARAEPLLYEALSILKKTVGPEHPFIASSLNNLAEIYRAQGKYIQAEPLHLQALAMRRKLLESDHPHIAISLNNLARLYVQQGKYAQAEPLYRQALAIREKALGPEHPEVAQTLSNLAEFYHTQNNYSEAEPLYSRALAIWKRTLGLEHPDVATNLERYADLLRKMKRETEV
jgi:tetratricopeptide (TPR) repeat protein/DNA-binding XRE family transcriptional regulator